MRLLHIISSIGLGGAEIMLWRLATSPALRVKAMAVVSLTEDHVLGDRMRATGIAVHSLGMERGRLSVRGLWRLSRVVKGFGPDVVHTWMYHSDLLGGVAARLFTKARVVWSVHHTEFDPATTKRTTYLTRSTCAALSRVIPSMIVCCSEAARAVHVRLGYPDDRVRVIPNGFDTTAFRPDEHARAEVRRELGIPDSAFVVGMIARVDPQKDHANLLAAARQFLASAPDAYLIVCGAGASWGNPLFQAAVPPETRSRFRLLGLREDIARIASSLDVATLSSSHGEAFPLAVGEAMACGIPCVVTDIGDSAFIVGDTGVVVPPRDPEALAGGWSRLGALPPHARRALGLKARARVLDLFSIEKVAERYSEVYEDARRTPRAVGLRPA